MTETWASHTQGADRNAGNLYGGLVAMVYVSNLVSKVSALVRVETPSCSVNAVLGDGTLPATNKTGKSNRGHLR